MSNNRVKFRKRNLVIVALFLMINLIALGELEFWDKSSVSFHHDITGLPASGECHIQPKSNGRGGHSSVLIRIAQKKLGVNSQFNLKSEIFFTDTDKHFAFFYGFSISNWYHKELKPFDILQVPNPTPEELSRWVNVRKFVDPQVLQPQIILPSRGTEAYHDTKYTFWDWSPLCDHEVILQTSYDTDPTPYVGFQHRKLWYHIISHYSTTQHIL